MSTLRYLILLACILLISVSAFADYSQGIISDNLKERMLRTDKEDLIRINIRLTDQFNVETLQERGLDVMDPAERRNLVVDEMKSFSNSSQKELILLLEGQEKNQKVIQIRPLWIVNLVNCYASRDVIEQIAGMRGIAYIDYDQEQQVLDPAFFNPPNIIEGDKLQDRPTIAWHVNHVKAPQVWQQGYTGENIIVAVLDSGVNYNHQDLAGRMWTHPDFPNHGYNFVESNHNTMDYFHHGTHVAGIVAGNGTAGTITGTAPGATIMAVKVLSNTGGGTQWGVWAGMQFSVEQGAHIMNLSLGWSYSWSPDRSAWRTAMVNSLNAGVIAAVAAGNEGSMPNQPNNVRTPGDCPPPWTHPQQTTPGGNSAAVTVGSTMISDIISGFSSRGPVTWGNIAPFNDYPLNPGIGLITPDIVAPGSDILSLTHNNNSGYFVQNGTSMATPAVAGLMALMLSKNPGLSIVQISKILEETAVKLTATKSNIYGSGRLDALAAFNATPYLGVHYSGHLVSDSLGNNDGLINPGELISISLELENKGGAVNQDVVLHIVANSSHVTLLDTLVFAGDFQPGEIKTLPNAFSFLTSNGLPGNYRIGFVINAYPASYPSEIWLSDFFEFSAGPFLEILDVLVDDSEFGNNNGSIEPGERVFLQLPVTNTGQISSHPGQLTVQIENPWVVPLSQTHFVLEDLEVGQISMQEIELGILSNAPSGSTFEVNFIIESQAHTFHWSQSVYIGKSSTFTGGAIASTLHTNPNTNTIALQPGQLTVVIPEGATVTSVDVSYDIISHNGGWISDQRSYLRCVSEGGTKESTITPGGAIYSQGRHNYNRTGLEIANGVQGNELQFELHVFRLWGGTGSNTNFAFVPDSTWQITVHYQMPKYEETFRVVNNLGENVVNATIDINGELFYTDQMGEATLNISPGCYLINVSAHKHQPISNFFVHFQQGQEYQVELERLYGVMFSLADPLGNPVTSASLYLNGQLVEGLDLFGLEQGVYDYLIVAEGYASKSGQFEFLGHDLVIELILQPVFTITFNITNPWGQNVENARITLQGEAFEPGVYYFTEMAPGDYSYSVVAEFYNLHEGTLRIEDQNVVVQVQLIADGTWVLNAEEQFLRVYPNPAQRSVFVELGKKPEPDFYFVIINLFGKEIWRSELIMPEGADQFEINLEGIPSGVYFVKMVSSKGTFTQKLIIR